MFKSILAGCDGPTQKLDVIYECPLITFKIKWLMGHKHNECFAFSSFILATLYFGIVLKLALAKKINGLRLSVVCEAFVNVAGAQLRIRKHG